jgi:energy-coupling factor transporter ATP-binding protein EcfA2
VHFPKTEEGIIVLQDRIDEVHAKSIISYIKKLDCNENTRTILFEHLREKALKMSKSE